MEGLWVLLAALSVGLVLGAGFALGGVALGGVLVFRTKRESHEQFFNFSKPSGDAFVIDDDQMTDPENDQGKALLDGQLQRFMEQYTANNAGTAAVAGGKSGFRTARDEQAEAEHGQ